MRLSWLPLLASLAGYACGSPLQTGSDKPTPSLPAPTTTSSFASTSQSEFPIPSTIVTNVSFCATQPCSEGYDCIDRVCQPHGQPRVCGGFVGIACPDGYYCFSVENISDAFGHCIPISGHMASTSCEPGESSNASEMLYSTSGVNNSQVLTTQEPTESSSQPPATELSESATTPITFPTNADFSSSAEATPDSSVAGPNATGSASALLVKRLVKSGSGSTTGTATSTSSDTSSTADAEPSTTDKSEATQHIPVTSSQQSTPSKPVATEVSSSATAESSIEASSISSTTESKETDSVSAEPTNVASFDSTSSEEHDSARSDSADADSSISSSAAEATDTTTSFDSESTMASVTSITDLTSAQETPSVTASASPSPASPPELDIPGAPAITLPAGGTVDPDTLYIVTLTT